ncbi:alpha-N-acetylgalactosaminide alpha-2,6-sialyltransferase 1-like [Labrus mixtus]|uniref:alpha-N-acetylgalactosaminide alpha-2,6-sialyltransferase 1-like n=1 Tax=Labrus mixtus TaxID=508554 RepID=UPI0029C0ACC7|nr:alpha-N-acetylgalactosaminide alpha-2,6-sialyltransferase 1-like [Labrus mixtus]
MDPADTDSLRHAIANQGALVGQRDQTLRDIMETLRNLSVDVARIGAHVFTQLSPSTLADQPSPVAPVPQVTQLTHLPRESHVPAPERYAGDLESISPSALVGYRSFVVDGDFEFWDTKANSTSPPDVVKTTRGATLGSSTKGETPMPPLNINSYKRLPIWDFEDVYNQDAPPRPQTCSQSLRNSEDEGFKAAFLNMSEWNRLSHFNNPFGFMGYKYKDVMEAVKLIPKPNEPLLPPKPGSNGCVSCAVVGTAGILNGSKMGKEINDHDYVIRMNGAVIKGHEEDVGKRTDIYVHTAHSITASKYLFRKYGHAGAPSDEGIKYVMIPEGLRDYYWVTGLLKRQRVASGLFRNHRPWAFYSDPFEESRFYVLHTDFLRYIRNRFLKSNNVNAKFWPIVRQTNGAFTRFLALHTCDSVSTYGLITEDFKKYNNNYYFENNVKTHIIFFINRDYILEKNAWKKLHDTKIMRHPQ